MDKSLSEVKHTKMRVTGGCLAFRKSSKLRDVIYDEPQRPFRLILERVMDESLCLLSILVF